MLKVRAISNAECKEYGSVVNHDSHLCTFAHSGEDGGEGICSVSTHNLACFFLRGTKYFN